MGKYLTDSISQPATLGFMQVGHDQQSSANCKSRLRSCMFTLQKIEIKLAVFTY